MKSIFFILLVTILCMPLSHAGFYSDIENNINQINIKTYEIELQGKNGIKEEINNILESENISGCITKDIELFDIQNNISVQNIFDLTENGPCYTGGDITISKINKIKKVIENFKDNSKEISDKKTKNIEKFQSIGIYTDGVVKNSEFDIIEDLRIIDNHIFTTKIDFDYDGEEFDSGKETFDKFTSKINKEIKKNRDRIRYENENSTENIDISNEELNQNENTTNNINDEGTNDSLSNSYACLDESSISNNGLEENTLQSLIEEINNNELNYSNPNNSNSEVDNENNGNNNSSSERQDETEGNNYNKINDNSQFPCSDIFCITIDFIMYNQELLGGWSTETISIEYLIKRSNEHIGKFASNSLVPSKMPNGNFELGLKDIDLAEMFHIGFQVTSKPVPILKIEKDEGEEVEDNTEFSNIGLQKKYYEALGLEYERRNDLSIYNNKAAELKTVSDSTELSLHDVVNKKNEYDKIINDKKKKIEIIQKAVENKAVNEVLSDFEKQFSEIELFSVSILNYTQKLSSFIKQMKKIPSKT